MAVKTSTVTAEHYTWGAGCDGWHLLRAEALSVIEERMPAGTSEQRHRHKHVRQMFYVLEGELSMELEGDIVLLKQNEALEIPPGRAHQAMNRSEGDVRFLVVSSPPTRGADGLDRDQVS
jgi:mannose-6-phosphate isomerase-like protein (cupin superfamily)